METPVQIEVELEQNRQLEATIYGGTITLEEDENKVAKG
jgi:hypothetical protein